MQLYLPLNVPQGPQTHQVTPLCLAVPPPHLHSWESEPGGELGPFSSGPPGHGNPRHGHPICFSHGLCWPLTCSNQSPRSVLGHPSNLTHLQTPVSSPFRPSPLWHFSFLPSLALVISRLLPLVCPTQWPDSGPQCPANGQAHSR